MRNLLVIVWLVMISSATGFGEMVYLNKLRNTSVEFTCLSRNQNKTPFALTLKRVMVKPDNVLYLLFESDPTIFTEEDKHRISVQSHVERQKVNVSIAHLLGSHTDLYHCVFHYQQNQIFEDEPAKTEFFLYVRDNIPEECSCSSYQLLLYALSAAALLLFVCVLILAGVHTRRPSVQQKPLAVPIYEEMKGVTTASRKGGGCHLDLYPVEEEMQTYVRPCRENPYDPSPGNDPYSL